MLDSPLRVCVCVCGGVCRQPTVHLDSWWVVLFCSHPSGRPTSQTGRCRRRGSDPASSAPTASLRRPTVETEHVIPTESGTERSLVTFSRADLNTLRAVGFHALPSYGVNTTTGPIHSAGSLGCPAYSYIQNVPQEQFREMLVIHTWTIHQCCESLKQANSGWLWRAGHLRVQVVMGDPPHVWWPSLWPLRKEQLTYL